MKVFVIGGVTVLESHLQYQEEVEIVERVMRRFGSDLIQAGHDLLVCSPYPASADLEVIRGAADALWTHEGTVLELHYPDAPTVSHEVTKLKNRLSLTRAQLYAYPPP